MLVICGGLMRTGSVAMFQIMREIVEVTGHGTAPVLPLNHELEAWDRNVASWANTEFITVTKLHRWLPLLEPYRDSMRVVMTIRDMRDVVVSLMNFRGGTFEDTLNSQAVIGNLDGQDEWEEKVPEESLLKVRYEDFMFDRASTTSKVASHMGITISSRLADNIQRKWDLRANIARSKMNFDQGDREYMNPRHISSGRTQQWRKALTPDQVMQVEEFVGRDWFVDNGYSLEHI